MVRAFIERRFAVELGRSSCLNYLHRLGFVLKRPKKRLSRADEVKRQAFVAHYRAVRQEAETAGAKIFFHRLTDRTEDLKRRCRTVLQARAEALEMPTAGLLQTPTHVDLTSALL